MDPADQLLTTDEAAALLRSAKQTLANWRSQHVGPDFIRVGARVRYRRAAIDAYLQGHTVALAAAA